MATYTALCVSFLSLICLGYCYENLSRVSGASASQSSSFKSASLVVDGNYAQYFPECAHTGKDQTLAWIQVDLGTVYSLKSVRIYSRNEDSWPPYRLRQFYLDASNSSADTSIKRSRVRCYTDNTTAPATPPPVIDIPCKQTARYVIVETSYHAPEDKDSRGPVLEICEIEVIGCNIRHFGENCALCNACSVCDVINGNCSCQPGHYAPGCQPCSKNCGNGSCDGRDGRCISECNSGYYGSYCNRTCSVNCENHICDQNYGNCTCIRGWKPPYCNECDINHYGIDCSMECSASCTSGCYMVTGFCKGSCKVGKFGNFCNKTCNADCRNGCHRDNAHCKDCVAGKFGAMCQKNCGKGCTSNCVQNNGSCACNIGWQGTFCKDCSPHYYGELCEHKCSTGCLNETCLSNGSCIEGCKGENLDEKCTVNKISSEKNTNSSWTISGLYVVTTVLFISIILNVFFIVRYRNVRQTIYKRQNSNDVQKQHDPTQDLNTPTCTYDSVGDNAGYQELGQLSQPSHYDKLK
ncbi:protein draper-like [Saccostrea cucullata]|uniref:protein draper-like n=1 Tax=Saccostrea cuccullata TaxID=36930 RepID=UPI002ED197CD